MVGNTVSEDFEQRRPSPAPAPVALPRQVEVPQDELLAVIWRRRLIVLLCTLAVVAAGFIYLRQAVPVFTSTSRVYVEQQGPKIVTEYEGLMTQSKNYLYTQCEMLKSTPILADAADKVNAKQLRTFAAIDNPIAFLKSELKAQVGSKDDIISLSFDSPYPAEAAQTVNAVVDAYITYYSKQKRNTAAEVLKILQTEKVKRDQQLEAKMNGLLEFKKANGALSFKNDEGNIVTQRFARLSAALTQAQLDRIEAESACKTAQTLKNGSGSDDSGNYRDFILAAGSAKSNGDGQLAASISLANMKLAALKLSYTDEHPIVQAAKAKITQLERDLNAHYKDMEDQYLAELQHKLSTTKEAEAQIQTLFDEQQQDAEKLNLSSATYATLESDVTRTEKLCDIINDRIKEINVTEDTGALNISILEVARPETKPTSPKKSRVMAMALVLGLMLGLGLALVRDKMDHCLRSSEEIAAATGIPVLGLVPAITGKLSAASRGQRVHLEPSSHAAEAYRTIRTAVYFGVPLGQGKTILITSPSPGEGKSTLTSNLAIAMAQAGQRTIIIDCDFRKPSQHAIFEVKNENGVSSILAGTAALKDAIRRTTIDNLDILPCGEIPPNPSEMLNSSAFADVLAQAAQSYDRILIDSPPVLPFADARVLGAMCDITLLVLWAEKSTRRFAEEACESLRGVGARILGAVVNAVPKRRERYGYYGGYYGYGHYHEYSHGKGGKRKHTASPEPADDGGTAD